MATPVLSLSETNSVDVMFTGKIQARLSASIICKDSANPSAPRTYDTTIGFLPAYIESAFPTDVWSSSVRCRGWIWASSFRFACFRASIWVSCKRLISTLMGQRKATHASSTAIPVATKAVASFFTSVGGSGSTSLSRYTPIKIAAAEYTRRYLEECSPCFQRCDRHYKKIQHLHLSSNSNKRRDHFAYTLSENFKMVTSSVVLVFWRFPQVPEVVASFCASASCYRSSKDIAIVAVVVFELTFRDVERQIFFADFVERANNRPFED